MQTSALGTMKCIPCTGATPPLTESEIQKHLSEVPLWSVENGVLVRRVQCRDYSSAMAILNAVAVVAESEQHHPDFSLTNYKYLAFFLKTHAIDALSLNDFIVAAKIDGVVDK